MAGAALSILAPGDVPRIEAGAELGEIVRRSLLTCPLEDGDIVVLAQKIVSKAEGRLVPLRGVRPSLRAESLARQADKDPRLVELILGEAKEVVRVAPGVLVVEHRLGMILANAGIDQSNIAHEAGEAALLLPLDPDRTCRALRRSLVEASGRQVAVMVVDSVGRAWRNGTVGIAIGVSGFDPLLDLRGRPDMFGRALRSSELGLGDEVAAAASLVMGQGDEGRPIAVVRGLRWTPAETGAAPLLRPRSRDLFR
ncbi:coenzyme F420-0:L-glutamate ligase [Sphingosinicella terrae]|uniref:coenzyme F420-0:L-glutamate ligase n=1 Tax=Sphingosinicella terrae TaxID=2172047 RepID=UPI000E0DDF78|nr:coenzyme F420-0:L-glutamate ligase [Sphingosinicella terrae]